MTQKLNLVLGNGRGIQGEVEQGFIFGLDHVGFLLPIWCLDSGKCEFFLSDSRNRALDAEGKYIKTVNGLPFIRWRGKA